MFGNDLTTAFRLEASQEFALIEVPTRAPASWTPAEVKAKSSRLGMLLVDVPGFKVERRSLGEQVVVLDEEGLAEAAGEGSQPASSGAAYSSSAQSQVPGATSGSGSMPSPARGFAGHQVSYMEEEPGDEEMLNALLGKS
jgi:hypothetical protein